MRYFTVKDKLEGVLVYSLRWFKRVMKACKMKEVTLKELRGDRKTGLQETGKTYKLTSKGLEEV